MNETPQRMYIIAPGPDGPCKIGIAKDARSRASSLQTGHPEPLHVYFVAGCSMGAALEEDMHRYLSAKHLRGEWFQVTVQEAIDAFLELHLWGSDAFDRDIAEFAAQPGDLGLLCDKLALRHPKLTDDEIRELLTDAALFGYGRVDQLEYYKRWEARAIALSSLDALEPVFPATAGNA